jgi:hypothetical protein
MLAPRSHWRKRGCSTDAKQALGGRMASFAYGPAPLETSPPVLTTRGERVRFLPIRQPTPDRIEALWLERDAALAAGPGAGAPAAETPDFRTRPTTPR